MDDHLPIGARDLVLGSILRWMIMDASLWIANELWIVNEVVEEVLHHRVTLIPGEVHPRPRTKAMVVITMMATASPCHLYEITLARRLEA
jgi:hypothetical protein